MKIRNVEMKVKVNNGIIIFINHLTPPLRLKAKKILL
ncbi:hypothetical protein BH20BAC1_BH20BAC1_10220 [soil metagenome]